MFGTDETDLGEWELFQGAVPEVERSEEIGLATDRALTPIGSSIIAGQSSLSTLRTSQILCGNSTRTKRPTAR